MTLLMLMGLMLARANGLYVPDMCWAIFAIQCISVVFAAAMRIDGGHDA